MEWCAWAMGIPSVSKHKDSISSIIEGYNLAYPLYFLPIEVSFLSHRYDIFNMSYASFHNYYCILPSRRRNYKVSHQYTLGWLGTLVSWTYHQLWASLIIVYVVIQHVALTIMRQISKWVESNCYPYNS